MLLPQAAGLPRSSHACQLSEVLLPRCLVDAKMLNCLQWNKSPFSSQILPLHGCLLSWWDIILATWPESPGPCSFLSRNPIHNYTVTSAFEASLPSIPASLPCRSCPDPAFSPSHVTWFKNFLNYGISSHLHFLIHFIRCCQISSGSKLTSHPCSQECLPYLPHCLKNYTRAPEFWVWLAPKISSDLANVKEGHQLCRLRVKLCSLLQTVFINASGDHHQKTQIQFRKKKSGER